MIEDTTNTIASSLKKFFTGTLLSRFSGLGREVLMAAAFGTLPAVAAFWMAFRFAHLLRRLFGEGGLHIAFVPHFESLRKKDPTKAALFFHQLGMGLTILLLAITVVTEGILGSILWWGNIQPSNAEILRLTMILIPAMIFICLFALNQSLLNCERSYFTPSVAPAVLNLIWMGAIVFLWKTPPGQAMERLAMVIVFAFAAQWFVTVPPVYKYLSSGLGPKWWEGNEKAGKEIFALLRPFLLGMIGVAATQINNALDALFARAADPEGPAFLWYALRLQQLPLALLGVGITGALLPPISRAIQADEREKYLHLLSYAFKRTAAFMIPLTIGIFVLGFSGINLVYGRGQFRPEATTETTFCLWAYGIGLLPMTLVLIFASAFYARKNYRLPTFSALASVGLNMGLNALFVFVFHMGAISIAVATSIAAFFNALLLGIYLAKKEGFPFKNFLFSLCRVALASIPAGFCTVFCSGWLFKDQTYFWLLSKPLSQFSRSFPFQLFNFCVAAFFYAAFLLFFANIFRIKELLELLPKRRKTASE